MATPPPVDDPPDPDVFDPDYLVTLDEIYHAGWAARKRYRIELLRRAVAHFWPDGHPARLIQISGTNGKGSVAHYLEQGLGFAGATGSWTGPHVFDYAERFHLGGERVSRREIAEVYHRVLLPYQRELAFRHRGEGLTFAELGILLALHLFDRHGVRWGVMEVGAGGRYTPLMALEVAACVVTNVGRDHPRSLGSELWQRALEKGGIARPGVPFFTAELGAARPYLVKTAAAAGAPVTAVTAADVDAVRAAVGRPEPGFRLANLALAAAVIRGFYPERTVAEVVASAPARLPARFGSPEPGVVVDVAHNADKVRSLAEELRLHHPEDRLHALVGLTRQRDPVEVFTPLLERVERLTVTSASYAGRAPEELADLLRPACAEAGVELAVDADPRRAYRAAREALPAGGVLVVTGSGYTIDQALNPDPFVRHLNATFGWRNRPPEGDRSR